MFLSKKTALTFGKPKPQEPKGKKVLGGWGDEDQPQPAVTTIQKNSTNSSPTFNLLEGQVVAQPVEKDKANPTKLNQTGYFNWDQLSERTDIETERAIVEEIVKPCGIRIKPNESTLSDFLKEAKWMDVGVVGSLLLSKIEVNYPFQVKAKALYAIEFLAKKNNDYLGYFSDHAEKIKEFPDPEDNVENYRKIVRSVLNVIGVPAPAEKQEQLIFVDNGYNQPASEPKSAVGSFIHENAVKNRKGEVGKAIIGPGGKAVKPADKKESTNTNLIDLV